MYAIVRTGGKQYRVERGQRLLIERLAANAGAEVSLETLLYRSDEAVLDKAGLQQVKVTAKVIEHVRGEKLSVFKFKPKRGYKRRTGHRQELTRIEVTETAAQKRQPARVERTAPRCEDVRRAVGERRRDHRAPARHALQARSRRGDRQGRHAVRARGRHGALHHRARRAHGQRGDRRARRLSSDGAAAGPIPAARSGV